MKNQNSGFASFPRWGRRYASDIANFLEPGKKHAQRQFVAISDGRIVGLAAYGPKPFGNELRGLVVAEEYHSGHIGRTLLHEANRVRFIQNPRYSRIKLNASQLPGIKSSISIWHLNGWYEDRGAKPKAGMVNTHVFYRHRYPDVGPSSAAKVLKKLKTTVRKHKR